MFSEIVTVRQQFAIPDTLKVVQYGCRAVPSYTQTTWCRSEAAHLEHEVIGAKASQAADHPHSTL